MKKWIAVLIAALLMLSFPGCGAKAEAGSQDAQPNQWGIMLETENVTPTGLTIVCLQSGGTGVFELTTGSFYVIQTLKNGNWTDVAYLPQEYDIAWTSEAWIIPAESTVTWDINWEWLYGELPAGEYRIGKTVTNFRGPGDYDSETVYARFTLS